MSELQQPSQGRDPFQAMRVLTGEDVRSWVTHLTDEGAPHVLVAVNPSSRARKQAINWAYSATGFLVAGKAASVSDWTEVGAFQALRSRISCLEGAKPWGWLTHLVQRPFFVAEEPLRTLIDDNSFPLTGAFATLWEARLRSQEGRDIQPLMDGLTRWACGEASDKDLALLRRTRIQGPLANEQEQTDILLFLLALARQNGFVDRVVLAFDCLTKSETKSLRDLTDLCWQIERWGVLGSGTGAILGLPEDPSSWRIPALQRLAQRSV